VGFLDGIFDGALDNLFVSGGGDKALERLHERGELVPATIYAIRVVTRSDSADEWTYGLDLVTSGGPLRVAVRQRLIPDPWRAPLGGHVLARHLDGQAAIDWPATLDEAGVAHQASFIAMGTLKKPLQPGIDDDTINRKRLRDGTRTEAQIVSSRPVEVMGMATENRRIELRVEDRTVVLKRELVPPYAQALAVAGAMLPVALDPKRPERVTIDWPTAAMDAAGARRAGAFPRS